MFKMRKEQKEAFRRDAMLDFEARALAHVSKHFPGLCEGLGDAPVLALIRIGIERAGAHGVVSEREVCKFIDIMLVFGIDFDRSCAWAREILDAEASAAPGVRMRQLHERAMAEA